MKVTINDVAKKAGVSITTVSMVLNNSDVKISEETRRRVIKASEELEYVPNKIARSLVKKNTNIIALIVPDISNPFYSEIAKFIGDYAEEKGYNVILINTNSTAKLEDIEKNLLSTNLIDGALVVSTNMADYIKKNKKLNNLKVVYLDEFTSIYDARVEYTVSGNSEYGGSLAGNHLLDLGHRNLGCVIGPRGTPNSNRRLSGFLKVLLERDIFLNSKNIVHGDYTYDGGYLAGKYLSDKKISAIFCFNDLSAYGVVKAFKEKGIKVPEDISIIGYDNLYTTEFLEPNLTTIDQDNKKIAKEATNLLIDIIENKKIVKNTILIEPKLIWRKTTIKH